jgi:hypothetical protein
MKMRQAIREKRKAVRAVLAALPSTLRLSRTGSKGNKKGRRRITIETERTLIFRNRGGLRDAWCPECGAEVQMARVDAAAHQTGLNELVVYQLVESGAVHFIEDESRRVLVCLKSLRQ